MLRPDRPAGGAALLTAGLTLALAGPAPAADWYTGAPASKAAEDWIVSLDASTTVTTNSSVFANVGGTAAIAGSLKESGIRAKVEALAGTYEYRTSAGAKVQGDQVEGAALLGYEWIWREAKLAGYVGLAVRNTSLSIADPANPVVGTTYGLKSAVDFYARPTEKTMVSAYGSFTTNDRAYFTRFKAGYRIADGLYLGPEVSFLGNSFYNQWRVGAHLTGLQLGPIQASLSAGYQYDREQKAGAYGAVDLRAQF
jgi:hypothetical protein